MLKWNRKLHFSNEKIIAFLFATIGIIELHPYFLWNNNSVFRIISILLFFFIIKYFIKQKKIKSKNFLLFISILFIFLYFFIINISQIFFINIIIILILIFLLFDNKLKILIFNYFYNFFILTLLPGLILYTLIFLGFDIGWSILEPSHALKAFYGHYYRNYYALIILESQIFPTELGEVFRFSGIYDEPGRVGTLAALLLAATNFQLTNWKSKLLLLSGILSFSFAFFLLTIIFYFFKKPIKIVIITTLLLFSTTYLTQKNINSPFLQKYIIERFEIGISDPEAINNRTNEFFEIKYLEFINGDSLLYGNGKNSYLLLNAGVASYKTLIYDYGLIGFSLIILVYILVILFTIENLGQPITFISFLILFTASIYQRPDVFSLYTFIIFVYAFLNKNKENK